ncbi:hypothetical protein Tco_0321279, partial [Tanacetum coccineum]
MWSPPNRRKQALVPSRNAWSQKLNSWLKRKRLPGDDGAGTQRWRHAGSLGLSTSTSEQETPGCANHVCCQEMTRITSGFLCAGDACCTVPNPVPSQRFKIQKDEEDPAAEDTVWQMRRQRQSPSRSMTELLSRKKWSLLVKVDKSSRMLRSTRPVARAVNQKVEVAVGEAGRKVGANSVLSYDHEHFEVSQDVQAVFGDVVKCALATCVEATSDSSVPVTHAAQSPPPASPLTADDISRRDRKTGPKAFEGMPVDQLMEEFDMVTAQQAALVAQLRARFSSERSQSVQKDEEILLLRTQLVEAQAEAESSRSYAHNLVEEKMALLVKVEQERANSADYKASCHWAVKYLEGGKNNHFAGLDDTITKLESLRRAAYSPDISISEMDLFFKISTNTCFERCAKLVDAILLKAFAFLLSPLGTCLMVNLSKPWISDLVLSRLLTPIRAAMRSPAIRASYSASLFVAVNSKH